MKAVTYAYADEVSADVLAAPEQVYARWCVKRMAEDAERRFRKSEGEAPS